MRRSIALWAITLGAIGMVAAVLLWSSVASTMTAKPTSMAVAPKGDMAFVPAGEFIMGSNDGREDEKPARRVYLDAFYIDKYEVTNAEYVEFLNAIGSHVGRCENHDCIDTKDDDPDSHILYEGGRYVVERGYENHPAIKVSWYGAKAYCEHYGKRLPTEAEWEKAARGTEGLVYPWGNEFDPHRLNSDCRVGDTTLVGSYPGGASPYGAYDMAGNVWEWVEDWYQAYPGSGCQSDFFFGRKYKVVRGGSWNHPGSDARCACRDIAHPARRLRVVGFRCAAADIRAD